MPALIPYDYPSLVLGNITNYNELYFLKKIESLQAKSTSDFMTTRLTNEGEILNLRLKLTELEIEDNLKIPIYFGTTSIKQRPLSSESLKLDVQYFSFKADSEATVDVLANIESYPKEGTAESLGVKSEKFEQETVEQLYH